MTGKQAPKSILDSYKKRQKMVPYLIGGLAIVLVLIGIVILVVWFTGPNAPAIFPTRTPTPTLTFTVTATLPSPTPSLTPTETQTPEPSITVTLSGPFEYVVQEGDNCWTLAQDNNLTSVDVLLAINGFTSGTCPIQPGQTIMIPAPWQEMPTPTNVPSDLPRGTRIQYIVQTGDTLFSIASRFNSTVEEIIRLNATNIPDQNRIDAGTVLTVAVNLVTATPTLAPTSTPSTRTPSPAGATRTPTP
jgi:LysM repeat protein